MGLTRHQISCWIFLLALLSCACGQTSVKEILDRLRRVQNAQKSGLMQRIASTDAKIWDFLKNEALVLGTTESTPQSSTEGSDTTAKPYFNLSSTVPPSSASSECLASALMLLNGLIQGHSWAVQMWDAFGKPPSGLLDGALFWPGLYTKCKQVEVAIAGEENQVFGPQYCMASLSSSTSTNLSFNLKVGLCAPDTCSQEDLLNLATRALAFDPALPIQAKSVECSPQEDKPLDIAAIAITCLLGTIVAVVTIATMYDVLFFKQGVMKILMAGLFQSLESSPTSSGPSTEQSNLSPVSSKTSYTSVRSQYGTTRVSMSIEEELCNGSHESEAYREKTETDPLLGESPDSPPKSPPHEPKGPGKPLRCLLSFSAYHNGAKLLSVSGLSKDRALAPIHGIRFISMTWVILAHTIYFGLTSASVANPIIFLSWMQDFAFQAISSGFASVDTFFLLSGALLSYTVLLEMNKNGGPKSIPWHKFYFHRFWRLSPPYLIVVGIFAALFPYLGNGPFWNSSESDLCTTQWWTNLLYVNNLVEPLRPCMGWSWYLANDMQFFIISPIFLIPLALKPVVGFVLLFIFLLASMISSGVISAIHDYPPGGILGIMLDKPFDVAFLTDIYFPPWARIGPYLIGIALGYLLFSTTSVTRKFNKSFALVGWFVAAVCCGSVIYGLYGTATGHVTSSSVAAIYNAVSRNVWALGVAWVIFACCRGCGGWVNTLLSWQLFVPLSRLTFMAYLIHPMIMMWFYGTQESLIYFSYTNITMLFLGFLVLSYGMALLLSLLLEAPMIMLEKTLLGRK